MTIREMGMKMATTGEKAECYAVCVFTVSADTGASEVVEVFDAESTNGPKVFGDIGASKALARCREIREEQRPAGSKTFVALALRHDCDANAVPYESDGALGHGWECGKCGQFLQAG